MQPLLPRLLAFGLCLWLANVALAQQQRNYNSQYSGSRSSSSSSSGSQADGSKALGTAMIDYDLDTGSVIVVTDPETNDQIKKIIDGLDRPVPQVLIKVLFLEATHTDDLDLGVEGKLTFDHNGDTHKISTVFGLANETQGGFYKILDGDLEATIRAIADKTKLEILSRPSILTRNNQQATITVGQRIPFITNTRVTEDGQTLNDYEYSDVGIILNVTPHIAPGRMVEMAVQPEISDLSGETVPISPTFDARVIDERSADTRVLVGDGKTVVIGGMMGNTHTETVHKVPLLGDIPYLGALFRRTTKDKVKTELMIFLTPLVVDNPQELQDVSEGERASGKLVPQAFTPEELRQYLVNPAHPGSTSDATTGTTQNGQPQGGDRVNGGDYSAGSDNQNGAETQESTEQTNGQNELIGTVKKSQDGESNSGDNQAGGEAAAPPEMMGPPPGGAPEGPSAE